jgi:aminoglycoside phosphotransferase (APT) family kinase protein
MASETGDPTVLVASKWRLLYLRVRIWLGKRLFAQVIVRPQVKGAKVLPCAVINISPYTCLKTNSSPNEVAIMSHLSSETSLPVPKVYGAWIHPEQPASCYLMMQRTPGVTLEDAWKTLRKKDKKKLARDLRKHLQILHAIPQPSSIAGRITSFIDGPVEDSDLSCIRTVGPFPTLSDFFKVLLGLVGGNLKHKYEELLRADEKSALQLTHGDLSPRNIIIHPHLVRITGIIDWCTCAWMPLYWERFKATRTSAKSAGRVAFFDEAAGNWTEEVKILSDATALYRGFR